MLHSCSGGQIKSEGTININIKCPGGTDYFEIVGPGGPFSGGTQSVVTRARSCNTDVDSHFRYKSVFY